MKFYIAGIIGDKVHVKWFEAEKLNQKEYIIQNYINLHDDTKTLLNNSNCFYINRFNYDLCISTTPLLSLSLLKNKLTKEEDKLKSKLQKIFQNQDKVLQKKLEFMEE